MSKQKEAFHKIQLSDEHSRYCTVEIVDKCGVVYKLLLELQNQEFSSLDLGVSCSISFPENPNRYNNFLYEKGIVTSSANGGSEPVAVKPDLVIEGCRDELSGRQGNFKFSNIHKTWFCMCKENK